jgi:uncharacterized FlgJ-related protein
MKKIITVCLLVLPLLFTSFAANNPQNTPPNYELLWSELIANGIKYPEVVFAQAVLESGHFKSTVFKSNNNLFGMKYPKVRETLATGSNRGYATFYSWKDSVKDYKMWQDRFIQKRSISNRNEYLIYLDKIYCQTTGYSTLLKRIIKKFDYLG